MSSDCFWVNDLSVLYRNSNFVKIIPSTEMSKTEKLNAIARFCVMIIIVLLIVERSSNWIYIAALVVLITIVIHVSTKKKYERYDRNNYDNEKVQVGRLDKNGKVSFNDNDNDTQSLDSIHSCKSPTRDNPYMNGDVEEIGKYTPVACNADDEDIKSQVEDAFNENLYKNMTDLFELKNSERQFYTVPVPNGVPDTVKFAKWVYGSKKNFSVTFIKCTCAHFGFLTLGIVLKFITQRCRISNQSELRFSVNKPLGMWNIVSHFIMFKSVNVCYMIKWTF